MASPITVAASPSKAEMKTNDREIPIRLTLGAATLSLDASGQWKLDDSTLQQTQERVRVLEEHNIALESEVMQLRDKCTRMTEESNMDKFKCQLLVEMLAVSSLDEERTHALADQERARAASIQADMSALLDQARTEGLDVRKLKAALDAKPVLDRGDEM